MILDSVWKSCVYTIRDHFNWPILRNAENPVTKSIIGKRRVPVEGSTTKDFGDSDDGEENRTENFRRSRLHVMLL